MMSETHFDEASAKRFLLGDVDESERQRIEELVIVDPEVKHTLLIAEEDLIEAFLDGDLSDADKNKFLARYGSSPQRRQWEIADSLRRRAVPQSVPQPAPGATAHWFSGFVLSRWIRNRTLLIPATAVVLAVAVGAIWFGYRQIQRLQESKRVSAIERQLSQLNSPSELGTNPPQMLAVNLSPGATRGGSSQAKLEAGPDDAIVEFRLIWHHGSDYKNLDAIIQRVSSDEKYKIPNLSVDRTAVGNLIRLRARREFFNRGGYRIILNSISKDGTPGPIEEYTFISIR